MQTELDEDVVRTYLTGVPLPEPRLDLPKLLDGGHQRLRRRRTGQAGLALLVAVAVAGALTAPQLLRGKESGSLPTAGSAASTPATVAPSSSASGGGGTTGAQCPATVLARPAGYTDVQADVVDPTGRYIGGHANKGQDFIPVLWTNGVPQVLPITRSSAQITAINASGVAVGLAAHPGAYDDVFRWRNGSVTYLKPPPGNWHVYPTPAINARGDIVINAEPRNSFDGAGSIAFYWPAGSDTAVVIPLPTRATVFAITDDRVLVGGVSSESGVGGNGYTWDLAGHGTALATPAGTATFGYGISSNGAWAVGGVWPAQGRGWGAVWNLRTGEFTRLPPQFFPEVDAVNSQGWVAFGHAVWSAGTARPLAAPVANYELHAVAISDSGLVAGSTLPKDTPGPYRPRPQTPVTWQC